VWKFHKLDAIFVWIKYYKGNVNMAFRNQVYQQAMASGVLIRQGKDFVKLAKPFRQELYPLEVRNGIWRVWNGTVLRFPKVEFSILSFIKNVSDLSSKNLLLVTRAGFYFKRLESITFKNAFLT